MNWLDQILTKKIPFEEKIFTFKRSLCKNYFRREKSDFCKPQKMYLVGAVNQKYHFQFGFPNMT